jgi:TRAP-type C4-dicarboxylate transport system permease small subunit
MDSINQSPAFEYVALSPVTGNEPISRISLIWLVIIILIILFYNQLKFSSETTWFFVIILAFIGYIFVTKSKTFPV